MGGDCTAQYAISSRKYAAGISRGVISRDVGGRHRFQASYSETSVGTVGALHFPDRAGRKSYPF
jgi:hypothetical protein